MTTQLTNMPTLDAKVFIRALYCRYFEKQDGYIELRFISAADEESRSEFYRLEDFTDNVLEEVRQKNATHHVYFGVNPRPLSKAKKQDDIKDIVCCWADVDGKDFEDGKEEALQRVQAFSIPPSILVDSGHGYHCYWILEKPIINIDDNDGRTHFKQTLAGVVKAIGGDASKLHLDSCLRLPGTLNIKDEPVQCQILSIIPDKTFGLEDFAEYRLPDYQEPKAMDEPLPEFGTRNKQISLEDSEAAAADVKRLEIDVRTAQRIITGALLTTRSADKTRSGRDMAILYRLISSDYDYATIKSIFFNRFLGCSNRISKKGEAALRWDVRRALEFVQRHKVEGTPQSREILEIKNSFSGEERRIKIASFITSDLITGQKPAGYGLKDKEQEVFYLFDKEEKLLMNLKGIDFYCYMRMRYGISKRDFEEIKDVVMVEIWDKGKEVRPHKFAHFDERRFILYVSDHASQVYRLDGERIELCDNGVDGVFFEVDPALSPYAFNPELEVVNYFTDNDEPAEISGLRLRRNPRGLSLSRFLQEENCFLNKFLVDRVNFIQEKDNLVSPVEQKLLLVVFFYSLFFESILHEKPIACFIGKKESGKSFIATSIGKILFGERYESCHFPEDTDDLKTALGGNYYLALDNLDRHLSDDELSTLCVAATGGTVTKRKLYTDSSEVRYTPQCFLVITSREPKFKRDDLVSRLLFFNTQKIESPLSRSGLFSSLLANRNSIMTEVLVNLNAVVKILRRWKDFEPRCISRIADWEVFGRKVCGFFPARWFFRFALQKMNEKKDKFAIEDDYIYLTLTRIVYEKDQDLIEVSAADLYSKFLEAAKDMKLNLIDFQKRYKSPRSIGNRLANIKEELEREFKVEIYKSPRGRCTYTFLKKPEEEVIVADEETTEAPAVVAPPITPEPGTEPVVGPVETDESRRARAAIKAKIKAGLRSWAEKNKADKEGPERPGNGEEK